MVLDDHHLLEGYQDLLPILNAQTPAWFAELRQKGAESFQKLGLPNRKDEEFRFISFRTLEETKFQPAYGETIHRADLAEKSIVGSFDAITIAFINGQFAPELSRLEGLPEGVQVLPFEESHLETDAVIEKHLGQIATLENRLGSSNDERFVYLNTAHLGEGTLVHLDHDVELKTPIHVVYVNWAGHGNFASYPRCLVVLERNAKATLLESHIGFEGSYFSNVVTEVAVEEGASLVHVRLQDESDRATHVGNISVAQCANSSYEGYNVNYGGHVVRNDVNVFVGGEGAHTRLDGVTVGLGDQVVDNHTRIDHAVANCNSFEVYKTVLGDQSAGVFNGKIFVYQDAQKTDAKQTNQTLLMSRQAQIDAKPQLEIFADDVKCTHGATIGQINNEMLFYLQSRGIPEDRARAILVYAFAAEVIERIPHEDLRNRLEEKLFEKLMPGGER